MISLISHDLLLAARALGLDHLAFALPVQLQQSLKGFKLFVRELAALGWTCVPQECRALCQQVLLMIAILVEFVASRALELGLVELHQESCF